MKDLYTAIGLIWVTILFITLGIFKDRVDDPATFLTYVGASSCGLLLFGIAAKSCIKESRENLLPIFKDWLEDKRLELSMTWNTLMTRESSTLSILSICMAYVGIYFWKIETVAVINFWFSIPLTLLLLFDTWAIKQCLTSLKILRSQKEARRNRNRPWRKVIRKDPDSQP